MGIFEKSLQMGKLDANRKLADGSMMTFKKAPDPSFVIVTGSLLQSRPRCAEAPLLTLSPAMPAPLR